VLNRTAKPVSEATSHDLAFAREMLPAVSRTFAPAIDILPQGLADSVRLAYLLCRVADTIEDAARLPARFRRERRLPRSYRARSGRIHRSRASSPACRAFFAC
jgi:phytoene/squalene synthetase